MRCLVMQAAFTLVALVHSATFVLCSNFSVKSPTDRELIAVGGYNSDGHWLADVDVISVSNDTYMSAALMPTKLCCLGSTMVNNMVYVVGGSHIVGYSSFFAYDVIANLWTKLPDFPYTIYGNAAVSVNGSIFSLGGFSSDYGFMKYTFKYDAGTRIWRSISTILPHIQKYPCVVADQSSIYFIANTGDLFRSDDGAHTWKKLGSMLQRREAFSCAMLPNGSIMVAGGSFGHLQNSVELYNNAENAWASMTPMTRARQQASAAVIPESESILVCGGYNNIERKYYDDCELFSMEENEWSFTEFKLNMPREAFGLFVR